MLGALARGLLSGIGLEATVGQMHAGVKDMVFNFRPVGWDYPYLIDIPEGYATWYTSECRGENAFCYVLSTLKSELPESRIAVIIRWCVSAKISIFVTWNICQNKDTTKLRPSWITL